MIKVTLPLAPELNRCLGHGDKVGEECSLKAQCARHATIEHDEEPISAYFKACRSELMVAFIPLAGFPKYEDDEQ